MFSSPTGVYSIRKEQFETADVYCDMDNHDGGWIVIQRNRKGSTQSFNVKWDGYEIGFGNLTEEFWYGLRGISCLTETGQWEMRLDMQNTDKTWTYLHYSNFKVGTASAYYPLTIGGFTQQGTDYFAAINGAKFSTPDRDNDRALGYRNANLHCAASAAAGWWYSSSCNVLNINNQLLRIALFTEMKIRPKDCISL